VPGAWDGFELAVLAILRQNLEGSDLEPFARTLVKTFGRPVQVSAPGLTHLFPRPETLANANLESVGIPAPRAITIKALANAVLEGTLTFDSVKAARKAALQLQSMPGLGEETAAYIAMRALGDPDAFSCTSLAFRKALAFHRNRFRRGSHAYFRGVQAMARLCGHALLHLDAAVCPAGPSSRRS